MRARAGRRLLGVFGALALAGAGLLVATPSAGAQTFTDDGAFTVPPGVCQVTIAAWGGAGGDDENGSGGGAAGRVQADFLVTAGDVLDVTVGVTGTDGGDGASPGGPGFNTGGNGGDEGGAGGGGSSAVELGPDLLIVAGGGGGAGAEAVGGAGGVAVNFPPDPGDGQDGGGSSTPNGIGGEAQGTPGDGTGAATGGPNDDAGGGGAGADPGTAGVGTGGGGGGGNLVDSSGFNITPPAAATSQVIITPAAPGIGCDPVLQVRKSVIGTAPSGFTVRVNCTAPDVEPPPLRAEAVTVDNVDLPYLKDGTPDAANAPAGWVVSGGVWQLTDPDLETSTCTATETVTAGAQTVTYACAWTAGAQDNLAGVGCPGAASGPDAQPRSVTFEGNGDVGVLTVTNSFPLDAVADFAG